MTVKRIMVNKIRIFISALLIAGANIPARTQEVPTIEKANNATSIEFEYNIQNPIPKALPKVPINEEARLQSTLSVEDLRNLASVSNENDWKTIIEDLTEYQNSLLTGKKDIGIDEALSIALANNPEIRENKYEVLASIWRIRAETRRWIPTITLDTGNVGYYKEELYVNSRHPEKTELGNGAAVSYSSDYFQAAPEASISWDAFDPERGPSIMIEKRSEERNKLLLNYAIRSLVVDVYKSFTDIEILLEQINAYSELVALEVSIADGIYEVYEEGLTSIGEVAKWRAQTYSSITQLIAYYQKLNNAYSHFSTILGSKNYFPAIPDGKKVYLDQWPLSIEKSIEKAKLENEKIKSEYINSQISEIKAERFINSYLPTLTLSGSIQNNIINGVYQAPLYQGHPVLPTTNQHTTNPVYEIYAGISLKLDGGINLARAKSEEMNAKVGLYKTAQTRNLVIEKVRNSYNGLANQTLNLESSEKSVKNSKLSLAVYKQRFMAGLTDTTPFLQAVNLYTQSIISRSQVKSNLISDYVNLLRATATWPKEFEISLDKAVEIIMDDEEH